MHPKLPVMIAAIGTSIIVIMWIVMWTLSALFKLLYTVEDAKIAHDMTLFFLALCSTLLSYGVLMHIATTKRGTPARMSRVVVLIQCNTLEVSKLVVVVVVIK